MLKMGPKKQDNAKSDKKSKPNENKKKGKQTKLKEVLVNVG